MSYSEFPNTNYYDSDLRQLLELYRKLTEEYKELVDTINKTNAKLDRYQSEIPVYVRTVVQKEISKFVADSVRRAELLQTQIDVLKKNIDVRFEKVYSTIDKEDVKIENYRKEYIKTNEIYDRKLSEMRLIVLGSNSVNRQMVESAVDKLTKLVEEIPKSTLPVFNPILVKQTTINDAISDLYNYGITREGFTALEWHNATHITCQYFSDSEITALDFWTGGKPILNCYPDAIKMFSPVSGNYVTVKDAIYELANYLKINSITAAEYDDKNLTAEEYENTNISAQSYDWDGKEILNV